MPIKSLEFALLTLLIADCASVQTSVQDLPPEPKPKAPAESMQQLPEPLHFRSRLNAIFGR